LNQHKPLKRITSPTYVFTAKKILRLDQGT